MKLRLRALEPTRAGRVFWLCVSVAYCVALVRLLSLDRPFTPGGVLLVAWCAAHGPVDFAFRMFITFRRAPRGIRSTAEHPPPVAVAGATTPEAASPIFDDQADGFSTCDEHTSA